MQASYCKNIINLPSQHSKTLQTNFIYEFPLFAMVCFESYLKICTNLKSKTMNGMCTYQTLNGMEWRISFSQKQQKLIAPFPCLSLMWFSLYIIAKKSRLKGMSQ
jgi:hypothetical protein